ncbi:hypothetical protein ACSGYD_002152, partial [Escherichia coli]
CSQAFHVANDNAAHDVRSAALAVSDKLIDCPSFVALNGRHNHFHADFSANGFTQTLYVLRAVVNSENNNFDIANYIYTTKGESIIPNNAEDDNRSRDNDIRNIKRNFSGNITIATYK